jgi:hypothetical protein
VSARKLPKLTESVAAKVGRAWHTRLRLQDWTVKYRVARLNEFQSPDGACGQSQIDDPFPYACITLLHQSDLDARAAGRACAEIFLDWEVTLVHELLHLHLRHIHNNETEPRPGSGEDVARERAIDLIARALVDLSRKPKE